MKNSSIGQARPGQQEQEQVRCVGDKTEVKKLVTLRSFVMGINKVKVSSIRIKLRQEKKYFFYL